MENQEYKAYTAKVELDEKKLLEVKKVPQTKLSEIEASSLQSNQTLPRKLTEAEQKSAIVDNRSKTELQRDFTFQIERIANSMVALVCIAFVIALGSACVLVGKGDLGYSAIPGVLVPILGKILHILFTNDEKAKELVQTVQKTFFGK